MQVPAKVRRLEASSELMPFWGWWQIDVHTVLTMSADRLEFSPFWVSPGQITSVVAYTFDTPIPLPGQQAVLRLVTSDWIYDLLIDNKSLQTVELPLSIHRTRVGVFDLFPSRLQRRAKIVTGIAFVTAWILLFVARGR